MGKAKVPQGFDLKFVKHWYLLANRSEAVIYEESGGRPFHFHKRVEHPAGKLRELELGSDRPGRAFSGGGGGMRHVYEPHTPHHDVEAGQLARQIAHLLDQAALNEEFSDLVIVAEPHFLGLLKKELSGHVGSRLRLEVAKEWAHGSDAELEKFLHGKLA